MIFGCLEQAFLVTPLLYFKLMKIAQKIQLNRIFHHVVFNFPWSVPKYLELLEDVATFQFTICYNWYDYSFLNGK